MIVLHAATWFYASYGHNERFVAGRTPSGGKGEFVGKGFQAISQAMNQAKKK